ncbi:DUF4238 domain-containing protein [Planctomycetota bacterium]
MSGRKQHYIPQSFLKGFHIPSKGKTKKVFVFKKGQPPYISSTRDVAAERHFYSELSKDSSPTLDDKITDYEIKLTRLLDLLREAPVDHTVDATIAAELITHLTIRGEHLRDLFGFGTKELITEMGNIFSNKNQVRVLFGIDADVPTPLFREEMEKVLNEQAVFFAQVGLPYPLVRQIAFTLVRENFSSFYTGQIPEIMNVLNKIARNVGDFTRNGHVKALGKGLIPEPRITSLCQFSWTLHIVTEGKLILPDCVAVVFRSNSNLSEPYIMSEINQVNVIMCPVCSNRLLIGHRGNAALPELKDFNKEAAACSNTFFVSADKTPEIERLADRIGEQSRTVMLDAVSNAVNELTSEFALKEHSSESVLSFMEKSAKPETMIAVEHSDKIKLNETQNIDYPVTFCGCADKETAQKIAEAVDLVVSDMSHSLSLGRLDSITFAADYTAALKDVKRGFPASTPLSPTEDGCSVGVAMAPLVIRNGVAKVCIVMRAWVGHALISEDSAAKTTAIHILVNQLAHVACVDMICQTLPEMLLSRIEDGWEAWLYDFMHSAWTSYFTSRISAGFDPTIGIGYCDILLTALERAIEAIAHERFAYRNHGNLEQFLELAISLIGKVTIYAGMLLGHYDGLDMSVYDEKGELTLMLEKIGLRAWLDVYRQDLARLFERRCEWRSIHEFLSLNRHIERVLWQFGAFPWRNDQGEVRVEISIGTDAAQLFEEKDSKSDSDGIDKESIPK